MGFVAQQPIGITQPFTQPTAPSVSGPPMMQVLGAAFEQENDMANAFELLTRNRVEPTVDPEFKLENWLRTNNLWEQREYFLDVRNQTQATARLEQVKKEQANRKIIQDAGWGGIAAVMLAAVVSPTSFIPLVGGARGLKAVQRGAASGLASSVAQEAVLQGAQETRTTFETAFGIGATTLFGGLLGGAAGYLNGIKQDRILREMADVLNEDPAKPAPVGTPITEIIEPANIPAQKAGTVDLLRGVSDEAIDLADPTLKLSPEARRILGDHAELTGRPAQTPDGTPLPKQREYDFQISREELTEFLENSPDFSDWKVVRPERVVANVVSEPLSDLTVLVRPSVVFEEEFGRVGKRIFQPQREETRFPNVLPLKEVRQIDVDKIVDRTVVAKILEKNGSDFEGVLRDIIKATGNDPDLANYYIKNLLPYDKADPDFIYARPDAKRITWADDEEFIAVMRRTYDDPRVKFAEATDTSVNKIKEKEIELSPEEDVFTFRVPTDNEEAKLLAGKLKFFAEVRDAKPPALEMIENAPGNVTVAEALEISSGEAASLSAAVVNSRGRVAFADLTPATKAIFDKMKYLSPVVRTIQQSTSRQAAWMMSRLSNAGLRVTGGPAGSTIENKTKTYYRYLHKTLKQIDEVFADFMINGETASRAQIKNRRQFNQAVGEALFSEDTHPVAAVQKAAEIYRAEIFTPLDKIAREAGLYPEDTELVGDLSYLNRLYNRKVIKAREDEFVDILATHYREILETDFNKRVQQFLEQKAQNEMDIKNFNLSADEARALREQLKQEKDLIEARRPPEIVDLEFRIAGLKEERKKLKKNKPFGYRTQIDAINDEIKAIKEPHLDELKDLADRRRKNRAAQQSLVKNAGVIADRLYAKLEKITEAEDLSVSNIQRAARQVDKLQARIDRLSDEQLRTELSKFRDRFEVAADAAERAEARLAKIINDEGFEDIDFAKLFSAESTYKGKLEGVNKILQKMDEYVDGVINKLELKKELQIQQRVILLKANDKIVARGKRVDRLIADAKKLTPEARAKYLESLENKIPELRMKLEDEFREKGATEIDLDNGIVDFTEQALESAQATTSRILRENNAIMGARMLLEERGPELARVLTIPSRRIKDFLETDAEKAARSYIRTMAPDIELTKTFGNPNAKREFDLLREEKANKVQEISARAQKENWDQARKEKALTKLNEEYAAYTRDLTAVIGRLRHSWGVPQNPDDMIWRLGRVALNLNVLRFMGGVLISSIPDMGRLVMKHGLMNTFRDGFIPLITDLQKFTGAARREVQGAGGALDVFLHTRANAIFDIMDEYSNGTVVEKGIQAMTNRIGQIGLFDYWNAGMKQLAGSIGIQRIVRVAEDLERGIKVSERDMKFVQGIGLDDVTLRLIAKELLNPGGSEIVNGVRFPVAENWKQTEIAERFRAAVVGMVDDIIITPGVERPLMVDATILGRLVFQFKSFALSSTTKMFMAGLQDRDLAVINGMVFSLGLGAVSYYLWAVAAGGEHEKAMRKASPEKWADEAIARSGLLAVFSELHRVAERIPALTPYTTLSGERTTRRGGTDLMEALAGPTFDLGETLEKVITGIDDPTQSTLHAGRKLIPYQNVFWIRQILDSLEETVADELNLPKRRTQ